ncbi:hypothetical protein J6590_054018 [Homalodisca vitripennis]|nr:hypothetical protein J6590_054018 [Homalodisca vitripennis]
MLIEVDKFASLELLPSPETTCPLLGGPYHAWELSSTPLSHSSPDRDSLVSCSPVTTGQDGDLPADSDNRAPLNCTAGNIDRAVHLPEVPMMVVATPPTKSEIISIPAATLRAPKTPGVSRRLRPNCRGGPL